MFCKDFAILGFLIIGWCLVRLQGGPPRILPISSYLAHNRAVLRPPHSPPTAAAPPDRIRAGPLAHAWLELWSGNPTSVSTRHFGLAATSQSRLCRATKERRNCGKCSKWPKRAAPAWDAIAAGGDECAGAGASICGSGRTHDALARQPSLLRWHPVQPV